MMGTMITRCRIFATILKIKICTVYTYWILSSTYVCVEKKKKTKVHSKCVNEVKDKGKVLINNV